MGIIREPLDVDFVVDSRPLTEEDRKAISEYIKKYKEEQSKKQNKTVSRTRTKKEVAKK